MYKNPFNFALKSAFSGKNDTFTQSNSMKAVLKVFFILLAVFVEKEVDINKI